MHYTEVIPGCMQLVASIAEQLAVQYPSENPQLARAAAANRPLAGATALLSCGLGSSLAIQVYSSYWPHECHM